MPTPSPMTVSYSQLLERVGHYLYGVRTSFTADQINDIEDCIRDGINRVYSVYEWSFFRPVADVLTTAPYSTGTVTIASGVVTLAGGTFPAWAAEGVLKVGNKSYSIATRNSGTQLTLDDLLASVPSGTGYQLARFEIPLPAAFESISSDSDLTYYPDQNCLYPAVQQRHDSTVRKWQQNDPRHDRPLYYSVRTVQFDPVTGSRKVLALYPVPDAAYVLQVPMILRPVMIDATNQFPIGGEQLSQLMLEACLASAEHNFEEREHVHEKRFMELLPLLVQKDRERSSPTSLGWDGSARHSGRFDSGLELRSQRMGPVYFNGGLM